MLQLEGARSAARLAHEEAGCGGDAYVGVEALRSAARSLHLMPRELEQQSTLVRSREVEPASNPSDPTLTPALALTAALARMCAHGCRRQANDTTGAPQHVRARRSCTRGTRCGSALG